MDSSVLSDGFLECDEVCADQLGQHAVLDHQAGDGLRGCFDAIEFVRIHGSEFFQHLAIGAVPGLCFFDGLEAELIEEDLAKLLGAVGIEINLGAIQDVGTQFIDSCL